jgi:transglutaminase-like putative cysteine protease
MQAARRLFSVLAAGLTLVVGLSAAAQSDLKTRTFRFTYTTTVKDIPAGAKSLDVWLPYPQSNESQVIHQVNLNAPGPISITREPKYGNMAVYVHEDNPKGPMTIIMNIVATRREYAGMEDDLASDERRMYLMAEPLVPTDGAVRTVAEEAVRGKRGDPQKARAIYEKVTGMMKYDKSGTGWGRGDAIWACDARRGNCTDFHALIIGMARSQGIPARFAMGVPLPEARGKGEIPGYHCWAELYVKDRWVPIDSSEAAKALANNNTARKDYFYGHHDENRLEFSRGRHVVLAPTQKGEPLNYFIYPYVEVDGKKYETVDRKFFYEDLNTTSTARR